MATLHKLRSLEMFTGAGGLALATHSAGFAHEALLEWNKDACETLRQNAKQGAIGGVDSWQVIEGDVRQVSFAEYEGLDLVAGGPPCQPFSIGGKHSGKDDQRDMIPEFIRAVRQARPRAFIMENVKGLTRQSFRNYFNYIILQLTYPMVARKPSERWNTHLARLEDIHTKGGYGDLHYNVVSQVLNSADYGVPQTRERVFIVGFRSDQKVNWHFPESTHSAEVLFYEQWVTGEYWEKFGTRAPKKSDAIKRKVDKAELISPNDVLAWKTVRAALHDLPEPTLTGSKRFDNHRLQQGARSYVGHTGSPLDLPSKTLKAGAHGVPGGENMILFPNGDVRYYSVREAARIQTFPDEWHIKGAWGEAMRQLGNAVPVELAEAVAKSVANELQKQANG